MTESETAFRVGAEPSVCSSTDCAPSGDGFTWSGDQRASAGLLAIPAVSAGAASGINSNKPSAQAQLLQRSKLPTGWTESDEVWVGTDADDNASAADDGSVSRFVDLFGRSSRAQCDGGRGLQPLPQPAKTAIPASSTSQTCTPAEMRPKATFFRSTVLSSRKLRPGRGSIHDERGDVSVAVWCHVVEPDRLAFPPAEVRRSVGIGRRPSDGESPGRTGQHQRLLCCSRHPRKEGRPLSC